MSSSFAVCEHPTLTLHRSHNPYPAPVLLCPSFAYVHNILPERNRQRCRGDISTWRLKCAGNTLLAGMGDQLWWEHAWQHTKQSVGSGEVPPDPRWYCFDSADKHDHTDDDQAAYSVQRRRRIIVRCVVVKSLV